MNTIFPQGESLRKAVQWISEQLKTDANQNKNEILNEAILRFDISPKDSEFLYNMYRNNQK